LVTGSKLHQQKNPDSSRLEAAPTSEIPMVGAASSRDKMMRFFMEKGHLK